MDEQTNDNGPSNEEIQATFEAKFHLLTDGFGQACENEGVELAIAIAIHPEHDQPIILLRGHQYDVTSLLATVLKKFKQDLLNELNTD